MYVPNIPGVSTSVVDQSSIAVVVNHNRTILLPIFSKYGKEGFMESVGTDQFEYNHGSMDLKKYGIAYLYGLAAAKNNKVISYRLLPDDATYANNCLKFAGTYSTIADATSKELIFKTKITDKTSTNYGQLVDNNDIVLATLAKNRGEGYNSIFATFSAATDYEKADANKDGETNYKFNFVKATVYEETSTGGGVVALGNPIVFSLMDVDPLTNEPIIDKTSSEDLYVNNIFKDKNDFMTLMINDNSTCTYQNDMLQSANIDAITNFRRFILKDPSQEIYYEIKMENYTALEPDVNGINRAVVKQRLAKVITKTLPKDDYVKYIKAGDSTIVELYIDATTKELKVKTIDATILANINAAEIGGVKVTIPSIITIDGEQAFYTLNVVLKNGVYIIDEPVVYECLRHRIYSKLLEFSMKLYKGSDGENLNPNGTLNFGTSTTNQQSAKELLVNFYNNNKDLREVLYPKYDFDYVPDWTENVMIQSSIINLADDIGLTMPLISCPHDQYNPKIVTKDLHEYDIAARKERLYQSSYNSMLYSGQMNKTHTTPKGAKMYMPFSYYAMCAHLNVDNKYSITEPVANIEKGLFETDNLNLTYAPTSLEIESLRNIQINTAIVEPDGTYIIDQLTMYKKASKLSRGNIVKVLHRIRKDLPKVLKSLIQLKETKDIRDTAIRRAETELAKWKVTTENYTNGIFSEVSVKGTYDSSTYKLRLSVTVKPIGTIESIDIPIIVV